MYTTKNKKKKQKLKSQIEKTRNEIQTNFKVTEHDLTMNTAVLEKTLS